MRQSPKLQNWPPSENLRDQNRILLFRGAMCLQVGIAFLATGLIFDQTDIHHLLNNLPQQFARFVDKLIDFILIAGLFTPLAVLWTIVRTPFGLFHKTGWVLVTVVLLLLQIFAMNLGVQ